MTLRLKTLWLLGLLVLVCLGASGPPPLPKIYKAVKGPTQGSGALALIAKAAPKVALVIPPAREIVLAWKYPPGIVSSNYWWNLETSTNLRQWSVLYSNVTDPLYVTNRGEPCRFFRLAGRLTP